MTVALRFGEWSLRTKMLVLLAVASLAPLTLAGVVDVQQARRRELAAAEALLHARADQLVDQIDTFNVAHLRSSRRLAGMPQVAAFLRAGARPEDLAGVQGMLDAWARVDPNIRGVAVLDPGGVVRATTERPLLGKSRRHRSFVRAALAGDAVVSDVYLGGPEVGHTPTIAYAAPVKEGGAVRGAAVIFVRATALWTVARASNELAGRGSFAVIFDRQGIRIGHTYNREIVFRPGGRLDRATIDALVAESRFGTRTRALLDDVRPFPQQFQRARASAPDRRLFRGFAPVNQMWTFGVARRARTVWWTVFYMIPEATVAAGVRHLTRQRAALAGGITVLALLAGLLFASRIERLEAQTKALQRARDELEVENRRVQEASRVKSEFLANMSHELRTPLNAILGFSGLLHAGKVGSMSDEQKEYAGDILAAARHLLQLINDILDLSKVESGRMEVRAEPVELAESVEEVRGTLGGLTAGKRITIVTQIDAALSRVSVDPRLLKQILYNYLSNAIKFSPEGAEVSVRIAPELADAFRIDVTDTGIGIAAKDMDRLFVAFQQLDAGTAKQYPGTGLGLALTKRIVEAQGGRVGVQSAPGKGSTFWAVLPREVRAAGQEMTT